MVNDVLLCKLVNVLPSSFIQDRHMRCNLRSRPALFIFHREFFYYIYFNAHKSK